MAFLTDTDYHAQIRPEQLDRLIENNQSLRLDAEGKAISQAKSRLRVRYNVDEIFLKTGTDRHQELVMYVVDLSLYHLHSRNAPGQVPANRAQRYQDALDWLGKVAEGSWDAGLPTVGDLDGNGVDDKNVVQWGSRKPRNLYF